MKLTVRFILTLLSIACLSNIALGQSDWDTYSKRSIRDVIAANSGEGAKSADFVISAELFTSQSDAVFGGEHRPISDAKKRFVKLWFGTRNLPEENAEKLAEEYLFTQDGTEYWLPVVAELRPFIEKELKKGDKIRMYFVFLGGYDGKRKIDWVVAVEEFRKLRS